MDGRGSGTLSSPDLRGDAEQGDGDRLASMSRVDRGGEMDEKVGYSEIRTGRGQAPWEGGHRPPVHLFWGVLKRES